MRTTWKPLSNETNHSHTYSHSLFCFCLVVLSMGMTSKIVTMNSSKKMTLKDAVDGSFQRMTRSYERIHTMSYSLLTLAEQKRCRCTDSI